MTSRFGTLLLLLAGSAVALSSAGQSPTPVAPPRVQALVVSGGCCHDYRTQAKLVMEIVGENPAVDWTIVNQGGTARESKIPLYASPDWIKGFDIVVHNECFGFVDDADYIRRIVSAHRATGVPAVVTHCAMHSYRNTTIDDWREFLGVTTRRHTAAHPMAITWPSREHAIVAGLFANWTTPIDELYVIEKTWPGVQVLATAVSPEPGNAVYPVVWTKTDGRLRVFGTTLGHQDTWTDPQFKELFARGFRWALGIGVNP